MMDMKQLVRILYVRKAVIAGALAVTTATAITTSILLPRSYDATATVVLNYRGIDPVSGVTLPAQLLPGYMATQIDILRSKAIAMRVVDSLHLADAPEARQAFAAKADGRGDIREWLSQMLVRSLKVVPSLESGVLDITFRSSDPDHAASVANAFTSEYQQALVQLKAQPLQQASTYFNEQVKPLRENLERAQRRLSQYQRDNGVTNVDNRLDVESLRLNELSSQLVAVQGQLIEAASRRQQAQSGNPSESPDVMSSPLIQNLKTSLAQAQARLSMVAERLEKAHPSYQAAKAEADKLRSELQAATVAASNSLANSARIIERREAELRSALDAQRARVLELNRHRDEMSVLAREVESAQKAYDSVMVRYSETRLEAQSNQADVAVLSPAAVPIEPATPKPLMSLTIALFLGSVLGAGVALLLEVIDRRVRSRRDLETLEDMPFLGAVPAAARPARPRLGRMPVLLPWRSLRIPAN